MLIIALAPSVSVPRVQDTQTSHHPLRVSPSYNTDKCQIVLQVNPIDVEICSILTRNIPYQRKNSSADTYLRRMVLISINNNWNDSARMFLVGHHPIHSITFWQIHPAMVLTLTPPPYYFQHLVECSSRKVSIELKSFEQNKQWN